MDDNDYVIKLIPRIRDKMEKEPEKEENFNVIKPIINNVEKEKELREKEEKRIQDEIKEKEEKTKNTLISILNFWNNNLQRSIDNLPKSHFPLNPYNKNLVNPLDIYKIINKTLEYPDIKIPSMLVLLISDINNIDSIYKLFKENDKKSYETLNNFFKTKIDFIDMKWQDIILPPLKIDFILQCIKKLELKYNLTLIDLTYNSEINTEDTIIEKSVSIDNLIKNIKLHPEIIYKITDLDLIFFKLTNEEILKLRIILAEKNIKKRNKSLDDFLKEKYTNDLFLLQNGGTINKITEIPPNNHINIISYFSTF